MSEIVFDRVATNGQGRTRADEIRALMGDEIVRGLLAPGAPLDESALARRFGVSRTPVREALGSLAESGLVRKLPHRGAVVAHPGDRELAGMFETMAELESLCAGLAAERMTRGERAAFSRLHEDLGQLMRDGDEDGYTRGNIAFHDAIYSGAHNAYLADLARLTRARVAPFRRAQFRSLGRLAGSFEEHERIVQAIQRGDREAASRTMRAHIGRVGISYSAYARSQATSGSGALSAAARSS